MIRGENKVLRKAILIGSIRKKTEKEEGVLWL